MDNVVGKGIFILLCLIGVVFSNSDSESSASSSSSESSDSDDFSISPDYFEYKVRGLNTALYYILHALQDDLNDGGEIDLSFFKRINAVATKIKYFYGKVDETNALMLGEILRTLPEYLKKTLQQIGYNFNEYTAVTPTETTMTHLNSTVNPLDTDRTQDIVKTSKSTVTSLETTMTTLKTAITFLETTATYPEITISSETTPPTDITEQLSENTIPVNNTPSVKTIVATVTDKT